MITCRLKGGLGNQLFQIMATIAYSVQNNLEFRFEYSEKLQDRNTYWDTFLLPLKKYTTSPENIHSTCEYHEPGFTFQSIPPGMTDLCLSGYFQSYRYFECLDNSFPIIELRRQQELVYAEFPYYMNTGRIISMHFRLGDYKHLQEYHPVLSLDYYRRALELVGYINDDIVHVFCESEDIDIVKNMVCDLNIRDVIFINDSIPDWKQMLMMSLCNINIIANSTFSWWGAYFNNTPGKVVVRPKMWFGPMIQHEICDLFPDDWIEN